MQPALAKYGVRVVALSKDTVREAAVHRTRDELSLTLLADPELEVIRQYGVEHQNEAGPGGGSKSSGPSESIWARAKAWVQSNF